MEGYTVPPTYAETFRLAELTFLHQRVFDPTLKKLVTLTPLPEGCGEVEDNYIGPLVPLLWPFGCGMQG